MKFRIPCLAVASILVVPILVQALPASAATKSALVVDASTPQTTTNYPAFTKTAVYTFSPQVHAGPYYVGDQSTGDFTVSSNTVPGFQTGDPQLNRARCASTKAAGADATFPWCDWIPLTLKSVPNGARWNLNLGLTWPGKTKVDPLTKQELKLSNLDFYLYVDRVDVYVFDVKADENAKDACDTVNDESPAATPCINAAVLDTLWVARAGERRRGAHPKSINIADAPASGAHVPASIPKKLTFGGPTVFEQLGDNTDPQADPADSVPTCPPAIASDETLQPNLCPKIKEHYITYQYGLLVISRNHIDDVKEACGDPSAVPKTLCDDAFNHGYTIGTDLQVVEKFQPHRPNRNSFHYDPGTGTWTGGITSQDAAEEGLPTAKQPGSTGPMTNQELLALKGTYQGPTKKTAPVIPIVIALMGAGSLLFLFFLWRSRRRPEEEQTY